MAEDRKISMLGIVFVAVSSILVVDTIAASASIGPASIFWWLAMLVLFFLPYGLVTAELGTAYPDEGGICDWVTKAFGKAAGARVAWLYWINYALWVPAVFYLFALILDQILNLGMGVWEIAFVSIIMSWIKVWLTTFDLDEFLWIPNIGSIFKGIIMTLLGVSGIYVGMKHGFVNDMSWESMKPTLDGGMSYLPVIIFNFLGFEVIAGASSALKNPSKDIPKAVMIGGLLIMVFYLLATLGILATIPLTEINDATGVIEAFTAMYGTGEAATLVIKLLGFMFLYTLVSNVATWAMGVNRVVVYAAEQDLLPKHLAKLREKTGAPLNVAIWNGVVSTIVMIVYGFLASNAGEGSSVEDLFWDVFSLGAVTLLMSYVLMFPAFLKLRMNDSATPRPYTVPGGKFGLLYCGIVPTVMILISLLFFFYVPGVEFDTSYFTNVGTGVFLAVLIGEVIIRKTLKK